MRGDLISYIEDGKPYFARISEVYQSSVFTEDGYFEGREVEENEITPIPFAHEILEKNWAGKWTEHSKTIKSYNVSIDEHSNISFQVMSGSSEVFVQFHRCGADSCEFRKNIKFVHELQHALRLCGIEKEITI